MRDTVVHATFPCTTHISTVAAWGRGGQRPNKQKIGVQQDLERNESAAAVTHLEGQLLLSCRGAFVPAAEPGPAKAATNSTQDRHCLAMRISYTVVPEDVWMCVGARVCMCVRAQ